MSSLSDTRPQRIAAIDALRGFDMFFLTGGLALVVAGINLFYDRSPEWLVKHSTHVAWEGFAAWDLVMPLFLFIVGTAMPFSFSKRIGSEPLWKIYLKVARRVAVLFLLGMVVQGNLLSFEPSRMSLYCNTLQAIASGYLIAAICLLHLSIRWQVAATGGLLAVYWLVMKFVSFSDPAVGSCAAGMLEPGRNLALLLDKYLMGNWQDGTNYAWILAQFGFGAMTMLGLLGGQILKRVQGHGKKLAYIAGGETVVHLTGRGLGGRNQELALAAAPAIAGRNAAVFSVGSDGTDGPTDAAGGYVDGETLAALAAKGWNVFDTLQHNDAYHALRAVEGLIMTGATGTNVNDVAVALLRD